LLSAHVCDAVLYRAALFRVQLFEMRKGHRLRSASHGAPNHNSCFVRNLLLLTCSSAVQPRSAPERFTPLSNAGDPR
jgi:hypothetical protein